MRVLAVIEARMDTTARPGSVLRPVRGRPALLHVVRRTAASRGVSGWVVATTRRSEDDPIVALSRRRRWPVFRASEQDPLGALVLALRLYPADALVRVRADQLAVAPEVIHHAVEHLVREQLDVCLPTLEASYPIGAAAECVTAEAMLRTDDETRDEDPGFRRRAFDWAARHRESYRVGTLSAPESLRRPDIRLRADTEPAFERMCELYDRLAGAPRIFTLDDVIDAWDRLDAPDKDETA